MQTLWSRFFAKLSWRSNDQIKGKLRPTLSEFMQRREDRSDVSTMPVIPGLDFPAILQPNSKIFSSIYVHILRVIHSWYFELIRQLVREYSSLDSRGFWKKILLDIKINLHIGFARCEMSRVNFERNLGCGNYIWIFNRGIG